MSVRLVVVWIVVVFELVSPIPGPLAIGAAYVLLFKPEWFRGLVGEIYGDDASAR